MDDTVIAAIAATVERDPDNVPLRLHLADLYLKGQAPTEALRHAEVVLSRQPDHLEALRIAAQAAQATGDKIKAAGFQRLLDALGMSGAQRLIEEVAATLGEDDEDDDPFEHERVTATCGPEGYEPVEVNEFERPEITFADVAGLEDVKTRLQMSFLGPLRNPDLRKLYGKSIKGGLLLYGPPGCGKTYIARAIAGELGAKFMTIGLTDVMDMWLGESERKLHELFQSARRNAPVVLFIDEIDALGHKRSQMRGHGGRNIVNELLAEMDGVQFNNEGVYVLAASNHPWDVDAALKRPGRLDRAILVLPPDEQARKAIFELAMKDRPTDPMDSGWVAKQTDGFSGADVAHVAELATEHALAKSIRTGTVSPISFDDVKKALKEVKPSTRPWFETARNYAVYANDGGAYDELVDYLRKNRLM